MAETNFNELKQDGQTSHISTECAFCALLRRAFGQEAQPRADKSPFGLIDIIGIDFAILPSSILSAQSA
jgi:hypothetical protein